MSNVQLSRVQTQIEDMQPDQRWAIYISWLRKFQPFWDEATEQMSQHTQANPAKTTVHRKVIAVAFDFLDDWYHRRKPLVKARRNEIDSAISFLRNTALQNEVSSMPGAASARNLAGPLRSAVYLAIQGYEPQDYPRIIATSFFDLAAVRSLFPADISNFTQFLKPGENIVPGIQNGRPVSANINNLQIMIERGCRQFGIPEAGMRLQKELDYLYEHLSAPQPWQPPADLWQRQQSNLLADVHYNAQSGFLNRP